MITSPVLTYQDERELAQLLVRFRELDPYRVLEIGSAYGGTLYHWFRNLKPGSIVASVDLGNPQMVNHPLWQKWADEAGVKLYLIVGDSHDFATLERVIDISDQWDFIFIDGGHDYQSVKADWKMYGSLCRPGGLVVFDDIKPNDQSGEPCEVDRLWIELSTSGLIVEEIVADHINMGNGLGLVHA